MNGAVRGASVKVARSRARSKGQSRTYSAWSRGSVEQRVGGALMRAAVGPSLRGMLLGEERWARVRASETMMGPEFENPANNWYRSSGDRVYQYGGGG
jgi:hypothetical protein